VLKALGTCAILSLVSLLAACDTTRDTPEPPTGIEAGYRLLFNDVLVGRALFALQIGPDGAYRIDAFTVPAGQMERAAGHEVLETSEGTLTADAIRPRAFVHSVKEGKDIEVLRLHFDWERQVLHLHGKDGERALGLVPATHDRLSYLLAARRLALQGEGAAQIRIADPEAVADAGLAVIGHGPVEVPLGHYQGVGVRRTSPDDEDSRLLWFDPALAPLPLRIVHERDGSTVDMQLERLNRPPNDPR
jgi:hypothetical protein